MEKRQNNVWRMVLGTALIVGMTAHVSAAAKAQKSGKQGATATQKQGTVTQKGTTQKQGMTEDQKQAAMMAQAKKYGTPGKNHEVLKPFVGKWTYTARSWMKPGDKTQESEGTSQNNLVLGGRFLKQEVRGQWNGKPFRGVGYTGYDNVRGEYQSIWMDNMMTGIMRIVGTYDEGSKTIKQSGSFSCPMTGQRDMWFRSEWKASSDSRNTYTAYGKDEKGKEFKSMEITYKRAK